MYQLYFLFLFFLPGQKIKQNALKLKLYQTVKNRTKEIAQLEKDKEIIEATRAERTYYAPELWVMQNMQLKEFGKYTGKQ